jgi:hypothetical protein
MPRSSCCNSFEFDSCLQKLELSAKYLHQKQLLYCLLVDENDNTDFSIVINYGVTDLLDLM